MGGEQTHSVLVSPSKPLHEIFTLSEIIELTAVESVEVGEPRHPRELINARCTASNDSRRVVALTASLN